MALTRVNAIADSSEATDPGYAQGLGEAVTFAFDYALAAIERGDERGPPIPVALRAQARIAARNGIDVGTVLRRYFSGYSLLSYFIIEEATRDGLMGSAELQRLLGSQAAVFDRLLEAVGEEHERESQTLRRTSEQRQAERIERLLEGELIDTHDIAYDFEGWHLGAAVRGASPGALLRELARSLDLRLLLVGHGDEETVWAWLGSRCRPDAEAVQRHAAQGWPGGVLLSLGEPGAGLGGWRLTHRQAIAALAVAQRGMGSPIRYADVALLVSAIKDDLLGSSLHQLYLAPLETERDGGATAMATLRAYFTAGRNISSAAAVLKVSRQAVRGRLRTIEERLGRTLDGCAIEVELALRLYELQSATRLEPPTPHRRAKS